MEQEKQDNSQQGHANKPGALFIPAGILVGMGVGFLVGKFLPGMFIGLGLGFLAFAISLFAKK